MNIKLTKFKFYSKLSDETNCFTTNILINDVLAGEAQNAGCGGETFITAKDKKSEFLLMEARKYVNSLPTIELEGLGSFKRNLGDYIDDLAQKEIEQLENAKFSKKMLKDMQTGIVTGMDAKSGSYTVYNLGTSIGMMGTNAMALERLKSIVEKIKNEKLKPGERILNTNLPF